MVAADGVDHWVLWVDSKGEADLQLRRDLARHVAPRAALALDLRWRAEARIDADVPSLSIVRYDNLPQRPVVGRAGVAGAGGHRPQPHLVAPLFAESLAFAVRADRPISTLDQLQGLRVDAGPMDRPRGRSAARLYASLFESAPMPTPDAPALDTVSALRRLAAGQGSAQAVALVGADPVEQFAALPAETRGRLKLLDVQLDSASSQRALREYLPIRLSTPAAANAASTPLASLAFGTISFLVAEGRFDDAVDARLGRLAAALCTAMPSLQQVGHARWRDVRAGVRLEAGAPYAPAAARALDACAGNAGARTGRSSPTSPSG